MSARNIRSSISSEPDGKVGLAGTGTEGDGVAALVSDQPSIAASVSGLVRLPDFLSAAGADRSCKLSGGGCPSG